MEYHHGHRARGQRVVQAGQADRRGRLLGRLRRCASDPASSPLRWLTPLARAPAATDARTRARVCLKRVNASDEDAAADVEHEVECWERLCAPAAGRAGCHPNIVTLLGHAATPDKEGFVYLVMELCPGGHLFHEVERRKKAGEPPFAERECQPWHPRAAQNALGVEIRRARN